MSKYVWTVTSKCKYEIPLYIADTAEELAEYVGTTASTIRSAICHAKKKKQNCRYHKIKIN